MEIGVFFFFSREIKITKEFVPLFVLSLSLESVCMRKQCQHLKILEFQIKDQISSLQRAFVSV